MVLHSINRLCPPSKTLEQEETRTSSIEIGRSKQVGGTHYKKYPIEPYEFISKNDLSYAQGNIIKYIIRYKDKNGIEDLDKAIHYIELLKKDLEDDT